jgi:hypothetical protein
MYHDIARRVNDWARHVLSCLQTETKEPRIGIDFGLNYSDNEVHRMLRTYVLRRKERGDDERHHGVQPRADTPSHGSH